MRVATIGAVDAARAGSALDIVMKRGNAFADNHRSHLIVEKPDREILDHEVLKLLDEPATLGLAKRSPVLVGEAVEGLTPPVAAVVPSEVVLGRRSRQAFQPGKQ